MKKTVFRCGCFLLLFAMLFLSSCKGSGKPPVDTGVSAEPILPEQLKGYSLVRPQMTSDSVISGASDLYEAMLTLLGGTPDFGTDFLEAGKEADSSKKEILVGHTNRPETAQVLETLKAGEFAVAAVGNKLVITGFTEAFTPLAVQWFLANYLTGTAAEIPGDLRHIGTAEAITLVEAGKPLYRLIRAQYATDGAMDGMYRIAEALENLGSGTPDVKTDSAAHDSEAPEILVGQTKAGHHGLYRSLYAVGGSVVSCQLPDGNGGGNPGRSAPYRHCRGDHAGGSGQAALPPDPRAVRNRRGNGRDVPHCRGVGESGKRDA